MPSLSTVANRYIALTPGPNSAPALPAGATLPASATREVVDLDQLFNTLNPKTRRGLQQVIQGFAEQYAGASRAYGVSVEYTPAALAATDHLFSELIRDQPVFTSFLVETAKAVTTIGARSEALTDLVGNADTTFQAVGSQQAALAQGLRELPVALRAGTRTFVAVPVDVRRAHEARRSIQADDQAAAEVLPRAALAGAHGHHARRKTSASAFSRPGTATTTSPISAEHAARAREGADERPRRASVTALRESVPDHRRVRSLHALTSRAPCARSARPPPTTTPTATTCTSAPCSPTSRSARTTTSRRRPTLSRAWKGSSSGQLRRCPGAATQPAADGSSPFTDGELLSCDPTEVP